MGTLRLTEDPWAFIKTYLPKQQMGRPRSQNKACFEALLYQLKSGCQWALLPNEYPPKSTVHRRFLLWKRHKVFYRLFRKTRCNDLNQAVIHIDATIRLAKRRSPNFQSRPVPNQ